MLGIRKIASGALSEATAYTAHLLEQTLPEEEMGIAAYFLRDQAIAKGLADGMRSIPCVRADLDPLVARKLGLTPGSAVTEKQLQAILSGRRADGEDIERTQKKAARYKASEAGDKDRHDVSSYDFCFSAPKSVSVAWMAAKSDAERASILAAHHDAVRVTLTHIEEEVGRARKGQGGSKGWDRAAMAWVRIDHFTARPTMSIKRADKQTGVMGTELYTIRPDVSGDPQVHSHVIIPNVLVTDEGRVTSISQQLFYKRKKEFGAVYQAALAANLRRIGIGVALCDRTMMAKLPVIPDAVCEAFSKRTKDAKEYARAEAARRGLQWDEMSADDKVAFLKGGAKASRKWKVDDLANIESWQQQAEAIGFKHETAITQAAEQPAEDRIDHAAAVARRLLAERLDKQSVVSATEIRLEAARGAIAAGFNEAADIGRITKHLAHCGVEQAGQDTHLIWAEDAEGQVKITTALHKEQEEEAIALVQEAAADTSRALKDTELDTSGMTFTGGHGESQWEAMRTLATGGAFSLVIGGAGSGKTALLLPIIKAHRARGRRVYGISQAWKQADALQDAGIDKLNTRATSVFLDGAEAGRTALNRDTVVVLDEISQLGTVDFLRLARLQKEHGFQIIAAGDSAQCASIKAGAIIDLLRQALGPEAIPEILTTIRQKTEREREVTGLFREASPEAAGRAIAMKLEDGTAEAVEGGFDDCVARVADLAVEHGATVTAPTNAEALAIGRAIRARRGIAGGVTRRATNGNGDEYDLELAVGDRVRLFQRTTARFATNNSHIGNNGTVLEITGLDESGLSLRTKAGKIGFVPWGKLMDNGRVKLAYGDCLTVDSSQGMTSDVHIAAAPSGTATMDANKSYVALSRHRHTCLLVTSKAAEMIGVKESRPLGVADSITDADIWAHVARNLSRRTVKENAMDILRQANGIDIGVSRAFQAAARKTGPTGVKKKFAFAGLAKALKEKASRMIGIKLLTAKQENAR